MQLEQRDKELAAIGAAIGCNCRPCIEHHIPAGREAGLSETELAPTHTHCSKAISPPTCRSAAHTLGELTGAATGADHGPHTT